MPVVIGGVIAALFLRAREGASVAELEFGLLIGMVVGLSGAFAIYVFAPGLGARNKRFVAYGGAVLELLRVIGMIALKQPDYMIAVTSGSGFGLAALVAMVWRCAVPPGPRARRQELDLLGAALFLPLGTVIVGAILVLESIPVHAMLDHRLYDFDLALGIEPSAWMGQFLRLSRLLEMVMLTSYYAILTALLAIAAAAERYNPPPRATPSLIACFVVGALLAGPLYWFTPAIGPRMTFGAAFPASLPDAGTLGTAIFFPERGSLINALPSMHFAWAVMMLWVSFELPLAGRLAGALYCVLTLVSTLGLGEHYLVDLVAGVPLALFVRALCMTSLPAGDPWRLATAGAGLAGLAFWLVPFRLGWLWWHEGGGAPSPARAWIAVAATIAAVFVLERLLTWRAQAVTTRRWQSLPALSR